jgi:hypothetical protein
MEGGGGVDIIIQSIQGPDIKPSYSYFYDSLHSAQVLKVLSIMGGGEGQRGTSRLFNSVLITADHCIFLSQEMDQGLNLSPLNCDKKMQKLTSRKDLLPICTSFDPSSFSPDITFKCSL